MEFQTIPVNPNFITFNPEILLTLSDSKAIDLLDNISILELERILLQYPLINARFNPHYQKELAEVRRERYNLPPHIVPMSTLDFMIKAHFGYVMNLDEVGLLRSEISYIFEIEGMPKINNRTVYTRRLLLGNFIYIVYNDQDVNNKSNSMPSAIKLSRTMIDIFYDSIDIPIDTVMPMINVVIQALKSIDLDVNVPICNEVTIALSKEKRRVEDMLTDNGAYFGDNPVLRKEKRRSYGNIITNHNGSNINYNINGNGNGNDSDNERRERYCM